ncbi:MAG: D-glycero-beta-D-manno-heptose 1-phosphate adenylyltransferase [candidate division Zixibacteria bacterium]|nr:D-glycero-beta-D-manno-heptose 1-phosphate adenylyltransferase [candidate division Zixibacteria bacterium]
MTGLRSKLVPRTKVAALCDRLRRRGKKIVFTNGVFDIIHMGHVSYLTRAKEFGDVLIIGLNTDASVRKIKGPNRPINHQADRAGVLSALACVDYVVYFSEETPQRLIGQVRPGVLVKGADYKLNEIVGAEFVVSYGGKVRRIGLLRGRSTSSILKKTSRKKNP